MKKGILLSITLCLCIAMQAQTVDQDWSPTVKIDASQRGAEISPYIYGQFIEHMGHCVNVGIWAEMLEDRKFFYPVGDKESSWKPIYDCNLRMNEQQPFVGKHSPESFTAENEEPRWLGVRQNGLAVRKGKKYVGYAWVKPSEVTIKLDIRNFNVSV
jgi:alpha-N-arabinofuranosidase